jgi:anti-sigma factor RsiW
VFAETLKEHSANVAKWRAHEKDVRSKFAPQDAAPAPAPKASLRTAPPKAPPKGVEKAQ